MNEKQKTKGDLSRNLNEESSNSQGDYNLFVGGLQPSCTSKILTEYFSQFGEILSSEPQTWNAKSKRCRGFAIIRCKDRPTFEKILEEKGHFLDGRIIECNPYYKDKTKLQSYYDEMSQRKLFVRGLGGKMTTENLLEFFSKYGEVEIAKVVKYKKTGKSKGFGHICFKEKNVTDHILKIGQFHINGNTVLCCRYKKTKMEESRTGGTVNKSSLYFEEDKDDSNGLAPLHRNKRSLQNDNLKRGSNFRVEMDNFSSQKATKGSGDKELDNSKKNFEDGFLAVSVCRENNKKCGKKKKKFRLYSLFGKFKNKFFYRKFKNLLKNSRN